MNFVLLLPLILLLCIGCEHYRKSSDTPNKYIDSTNIAITHNTNRSSFYSFWGIDSIVKSNYNFTDSIDSISISRHTFEALYLTCHKGRANIRWFDFLKTSNPDEYKLISNIHTAHALVIGKTEFSFNGKGDVKLSKTVQESTNVIIAISVYSLYSKGMKLGKTIIIDSIKEKI